MKKRTKARILRKKKRCTKSDIVLSTPAPKTTDLPKISDEGVWAAFQKIKKKYARLFERLADR